MRCVRTHAMLAGLLLLAMVGALVLLVALMLAASAQHRATQPSYFYLDTT